MIFSCDFAFWEKSVHFSVHVFLEIQDVRLMIFGTFFGTCIFGNSSCVRFLENRDTEKRGRTLGGTFDVLTKVTLVKFFNKFVFLVYFEL